MGMTYDLLPEAKAGLAGGLILGSAGWSSPGVVVLLAISPLALLAFALVERKAGADALLPPDVVSNPTFAPAPHHEGAERRLGHHRLVHNRDA
jgi:hypothetical protein